MSHRRGVRAAVRERTVCLSAGMALAVAAVVGAVALATPPSALAIPGLERKAGPVVSGTHPVKLSSVSCPLNKHVIGGGASVDDEGRKSVRLTKLWPFSPASPSLKDSWTAVAEAADLDRSFSWSLQSFAICAYKSDLENYRSAQYWSGRDPAEPFKTAAPGCPPGTVAYGAGAEVTPYETGQLGLQLNRTSGPLDIARAAGRRAPNFTGSWWDVRSKVICAAPQGEIQAAGAVAPGATATMSCPSGFKVHGPGGGGGLTDGGPAWLQKIVPRPGLDGVDVALTAPLYPSIGGIVAHSTCAR
jgi:hypothetical protein